MERVEEEDELISEEEKERLEELLQEVTVSEPEEGMKSLLSLKKTYRARRGGRISRLRIRSEGS